MKFPLLRYRGSELIFQLELRPIARAWFYMPMVHSEDIAMQRLAFEKYKHLEEISPPEDLLIFKRFHLVAIKHFKYASLYIA
jgi:uncharacterized protein (DUF924 family)